MDKKRILEFSTYAKIGGTQKLLLDFLCHASYDRYTYYMCVLLEDDVLNEEVSKLHIENTSFHMRGYWDLRAWWRLYRFAKDKQIDLIQTYGLKADIIGRIVGKFLGIPANITSVHSTDPWRKWYHVALDVLTSGLTDMYISTSEAGRMAVHHRERIPLSKILTIPNGIDLTKYTPEHVDSQKLKHFRKIFEIDPRTQVIGIVANLCKMKGHKIIVDALPSIQKSFPELKCLFVGTDFLNGEIHRYVNEKHLEHIIVFTEFQKDIPEMLSLLDVFLLPSQWEGLPTALLEAMAMKRPIVASSVGGIPEIIISEQTGLLIPPEDPDALAEAVVFLLENPHVAHAMGEASYKLIREHFSVQSFVAQMEAVYDQLIDQKTARNKRPGIISR